jgi:methylenetetrahydrofolate dehydrogenase (NADP+)/methenyltetrahydrofolate cyclohydrolase
MAIILDGRKISNEIKEELKAKTLWLKEQKKIVPCLALLLVGDNPSSQIYVASKEKACKEIGFKSIVIRLPQDASESEVLSVVKIWANDKEIHGILVQLPLPKHINENNVIMAIPPAKDVDGFHPESMGRLVIGLPGFVPCTPAGIIELIKRYDIETKGKHVVVVSRSNIVGKPIANLLYQKSNYANSIVTICHTAARDLSYFTKQADILIAAMGVPKAIRAKDVKDSVVVFDVGINRIIDTTKEKGYSIVGDVDFEEVAPKAFAITPVPGGVGLMTIAMLMNNTFIAANNFNSM